MKRAEDDEPEAEREDEPDEPSEDSERPGKHPGKDSGDDADEDADDAAEADDKQAKAPEQPEASDDDRPDFARDWPRSADLDRLLLAFQRGNYAFVRSEGPRIAGAASDARVRDAARDLRKRIDPDPLAAILLFVAIALLIALSGYYLSGAHQHDEAPAPNVKPQPVPIQPVPIQPRPAPQPRST